MPASQAAATPPSDLRDIIEAYHAVTERLQQSHEMLQSEVLRLREQLASADAQLQRSKRLAALGEMAAGIAHEVRNPLAAIGLYAEMIQQDADAWNRLAAPHPGGHTQPAPEIEQAAAKIQDAVRGLSGIVTDVLHFARTIEAHAQHVPALPLVQRVVDAHRPALDAAAVEVTLDIEEGGTIFADPALLNQALLNLVRNAADAMQTPADPDGPQPARCIEIALSQHPEGHEDLFRITDCGPGIDADTIDRIFNPFFTTRSTGTGLGLAIVHRIVDAHQGSITVHNHPKHGGAVFTLTLPHPQASRDPNPNPA